MYINPFRCPIYPDSCLIIAQDRSAALTALLISAAHEDKTGHTLRQIYQEISNLGLSHLLVSFVLAIGV